MWQSYLLGKALRIGDTDIFLHEYDKCLQELEDNDDENGKLFELEDIKELARNISDLSVTQYHIIEESFREGYIKDSNDTILGGSLNDILVSLSSKLYTDSGVCSDGDNDSMCNKVSPKKTTDPSPLTISNNYESQVKLDNNTLPVETALKVSAIVSSDSAPLTTADPVTTSNKYTPVKSHCHSRQFSSSRQTNNYNGERHETKFHQKDRERTSLQDRNKSSNTSVNGMYMYDNGDIVKVERKRSTARNNSHFGSSDYYYNSPHHLNVNYLWKSKCIFYFNDSFYCFNFRLV